MAYLYPNEELVAFSTAKWNRIQEALRGKPSRLKSRTDIQKPSNKPPFPDPIALKLILDIVYHVSFLVEESRRIAVRVAYLPPDASEEDGVYDLPKKPIALVTPVSFTVSEILRLAPALDATKSMILVCPSDAVQLKADYPLAIWGVYHQGSEWWRAITGKESGAQCPPNCFTLSTFAPGNICATTSGIVIFRLSGGQLLDTPLEDLSEGRVGSFFADAVKSLYKDACQKLRTKRYHKDKDEDAHPEQCYFQMLENITNLASEHHHGATFIFLPNEDYLEEPHVRDGLFIKYRVGLSNIWEHLVEQCVANRKYYDLLFPGPGKFTFLTSKRNASASDLKSLIRWEEQKDFAEEAIAEFASFVSSLSAVDGAVVLTTKFQVLGFGAEITVHSPTPAEIRIAKDALGVKYSQRPITAYGTRHRSAFRFCHNLEDSLCIVISQDGPVRIIKAIGSHVYLWDNVHMGPYGL